MILNLSTDVRNDQLQAIVNRLDAGAGPAKFLLYTGPKPAAGAAITTEILLGTCVLSDPSGTVSAGELTFSAISDDVSADDSGDIAWVRGVDSNDVWVLDMDASDEAGNGVAKFNTVTAQTGGIIQFLSGVLTAGNV